MLATFIDINESHWAYAPMMSLYKRNIITGYGDGTVQPDRAITRAEFIKILVQISNTAIDTDAEDFADVTQAHWAYNYNLF